MSLILTTFEIALLMMLPLMLFYMQSRWQVRTYIPIIVLLYVIWYATYALFHELSHMTGNWIMGKAIIDNQLIPHLSEGQVGTGFVKYDFQGDYKDFVIMLMPYARDLLLVVAGYLLIRKRMFKQAFWAGLVLLILVLSSLFDIVNNYLAYVLGSLNDFNAMTVSAGGLVSHATGITLTAITFYLSVKAILVSRNYPDALRVINNDILEAATLIVQNAATTEKHQPFT